MRLSAVVALAGAAALLGGCVYDPYTGLYEPCCNYYGSPYGYYRYPPPYYGPGPYGPQQGPYQGSPQGPNQAPYYGAQPGSMPPPPPGRPGAAAYPSGNGNLAQRFATANVTHDGRLTRQQAATAMPMVARNFDEIDVEHKGYVTLPEIRAFAAERRAGQTANGG